MTTVIAVRVREKKRSLSVVLTDILHIHLAALLVSSYSLKAYFQLIK
jgi:hypothetical protein